MPAGKRRPALLTPRPAGMTREGGEGVCCDLRRPGRQVLTAPADGLPSTAWPGLSSDGEFAHTAPLRPVGRSGVELAHVVCLLHSDDPPGGAARRRDRIPDVWVPLDPPKGGQPPRGTVPHVDHPCQVLQRPPVPAPGRRTLAELVGLPRGPRGPKLGVLCRELRQKRMAPGDPGSRGASVFSHLECRHLDSYAPSAGPCDHPCRSRRSLAGLRESAGGDGRPSWCGLRGRVVTTESLLVGPRLPGGGTPPRA